MNSQTIHLGLTMTFYEQKLSKNFALENVKLMKGFKVFQTIINFMNSIIQITIKKHATDKF